MALTDILGGLFGGGGSGGGGGYGDILKTAGSAFGPWGSIIGSVAGDLLNQYGTKDKQYLGSESSSTSGGTMGLNNMRGVLSMLPALQSANSWSKMGLNGPAAEQNARLWQGTAGSMFGDDRRTANALESIGSNMMSNVFSQNANASKMAGQSLGNLRRDTFSTLNNVGSTPASMAAVMGKLGEGNMAGANQLFQSNTQAAQNAMQGRSQNIGMATDIRNKGRRSWFENMIEPTQVNKSNLDNLLNTAYGAGTSSSKSYDYMQQNKWQGLQSVLGKLGSEGANLNMYGTNYNQGYSPNPDATDPMKQVPSIFQSFKPNG